jgi:small-conductance mechanosensitive channel
MDMISGWIAGHAIAIAATILIGTLLFIIGSAFVGQLVTKAVTRTHQRNWPKKDIEKRQKTLVSLFITLWQIVIVIVVVGFIIHVLFPTATLAPLFASAGIIGVALGFGAQSLVKDFLTGIFIIAENQYRVGDVIDINGFGGTVERIGSRSTAIRDADGNVHYFPNGMIQHVINKTMGYSMARFSILLAPDADLDKAIEVINALGQKIALEADWKAKIIDAPKFVFFGDFTANSVELFIAGKTQPSDQWGLISEMRQRLLSELRANSVKLGMTACLPTAKK